jgi:hypothetical protein
MNSLGGFAARTLVATCMAGLAGPSIAADTLIDDLESAGFPVNRLGGSWYVRSGNAGGAVPSMAQQRVSPGAGGTGNAYSATGAMPPLLAFVYGECGTQLEPGGDADVSLALFAAIRFDISTVGGGPD